MQYSGLDLDSYQAGYTDPPARTSTAMQVGIKPAVAELSDHLLLSMIHMKYHLDGAK